MKHLTYCSNVHPGETWDAVFLNLQQFLLPLKEEISPHHPFGMGLRLSFQAAQELLVPQTLNHFQLWLQETQTYVATFNGFVYGNFHHQPVKASVYQPDWNQSERLRYSLLLVELASALTPAGTSIGISTSPLAYQGASQKIRPNVFFEECSFQLMQVVQRCVEVFERTGQTIHLDLEPEPDCVLYNTQSTLDFFQEKLWPLGSQLLSKTLGCSRSQAEMLIRKHVRLCYDACHFAVAYEDPQDTLREFKKIGLGIGKIQLSSAIQATIPQKKSERLLLRDTLQTFADGIYLHQVVVQDYLGQLYRYRDLEEALRQIHSPQWDSLRAHYHIPLYAIPQPPLFATHSDLLEVIEYAQQENLTSCYEIETYTWEVLPPTLKTDLLTSIRKEYEWVLSHLTPDAVLSSYTR